MKKSEKDERKRKTGPFISGLDISLGGILGEAFQEITIRITNEEFFDCDYQKCAERGSCLACYLPSYRGCALYPANKKQKR